MVSDFVDLPVTTLAGRQTTFGAMSEGRVALVVNVASRCGLTPQYTALEGLQKTYADRGFTVLGFPCNQFHGQEPGTADEIAQFCSSEYGVTFPMSSKIDVNGDDRDPIYAALIAAGGPAEIRWNFEKFLVDGAGTVLARFAPQTEPDAPEVIDEIERALTA
jgi:glutathione peroxidase